MDENIKAETLTKTNTHIEVGIDEVGRGCLFGRVYCAAVILPENFDDFLDKKLVLRDSKKVSKKKREIIRKIIEEHAIDYSVAYSESFEVDRDNILQCTLNTMHKCLNKLKTNVDLILVDGNHFNDYYNKENNLVPHRCIIGGDDSNKSIAAASILAKTHRDEYIQNLCEENEILKRYNIHNNMGYGTQAHIEGIKKYGIIDGHRLTFGICKKKSLFI